MDTWCQSKLCNISPCLFVSLFPMRFWEKFLLEGNFFLPLFFMTKDFVTTFQILTPKCSKNWIRQTYEEAEITRWDKSFPDFWEIDRQVDTHIHTYIHTYMHTYIHTDRQTEKDKQRQTERERDKQTEGECVRKAIYECERQRDRAI